MVVVTRARITPLRSAAIFLAILYTFTFGWMLGNPPRLNSLGSFLAWFLPVVWMPTIVAIVLMAIERRGAGDRNDDSNRQPPCRSARQGKPLAYFTQGGLGAKRAAWAMGVAWSLWHVPAFFTPGLPHQFMPMWLVLPAVACFGVLMAFVFNGAGGSVLVTMAAHLSLNVFSGIGGIEFGSRVFWGVVAAGMAGTAILVTSYSWGDLRDRSVDGDGSPTFSSPC